MSNQTHKFTQSEEEKEIERLENERLAAKKQAVEDFESQQKDLAKVRKATGYYYSFFSKPWSVIYNIIKLTGSTIGVAAKIIPPIKAMIEGFNSIVEIIEAVFISQETLNRRVVKAFNGTVSTVLSIAAVALAFNPATAPLGIALSLGATAVATAKEAFFWYKANKDLKKMKSELEKTEKNTKEKIYSIVYKEHESDIKKLKQINHEIPQIKDPLQLKALQQEKDNLIHNIDEAVNHRPEILESRNHIKQLKSNLAKLTTQHREQRKSFFYSALSFIGISLAAVSAFAIAGIIVANPITLGIAATTILAVITVASIKDKLLPKQAINPLPQVSAIENENKLSEPKKSVHFNETFDIVHKISLHEHKDENEILKSDMNFYHQSEIDQNREKSMKKSLSEDKAQPQPTIKNNEPPDPEHKLHH